LADWIVTSRNVDDIIAHLYQQGKKVIYSPDRNMGAYLNFQYGYEMPLWDAVCEVHDQFNESALTKIYAQTAGDKLLIAHPESPLPVLRRADYIGSTSQLLKWVQAYSGDPATVIFIATEDGILYNMKKSRPELNLQQAPTYNGCQCNSCPYMKLNTLQAVKNAQQGISGLKIDYLSPQVIEQAKVPIDRMIDFSNKYYQ
jgi:quinolinate synthase